VERGRSANKKDRIGKCFLRGESVGKKIKRVIGEGPDEIWEGENKKVTRGVFANCEKGQTDWGRGVLKKKGLRRNSIPHKTTREGKSGGGGLNSDAPKEVGKKKNYLLQKAERGKNRRRKKQHMTKKSKGGERKMNFLF